MERQFVLIDDDPTNNMVCKFILGRAFPEIETVTFEHPSEGLFYLLSLRKAEVIDKEVILLLDINMNVLNGFDIIEELLARDINTLRGIKIYMLSSSINKNDKTRAMSYGIVHDFIEKPLTLEKALIMFSPASTSMYEG